MWILLRAIIPTSVGNKNQVSANNTFVVGNNVKTSLDNAVVLGNNSTAES